MMREKKPEKDLRGKRQKAAVLGLNSRQQYMLSYLSRAQKAQWKSYSPVQQRKILEEIENMVKDKCDFITLGTSTKDYEKILGFYIKKSGMTFHSAHLYKKV